MAPSLYKTETNMSHLASITTRHRNSRLRDAIFAAFVALATIVSVTTVSSIAEASSTTHVAAK
jgi:hypothetical protein